MIPFWLAWTIALSNIFLGLAIPIFYPEPLALIISIAFLIVGLMMGFILPPTYMDLILVPLLTILGAFLLLTAGIITIAVLPWWVIITIGLIADVIAFTTGFIPLFGDFFGAVINALVVFTAIWFLAGIIPAILLGFVAFAVSLFPGPIPLNTIAFAGIKLLFD